MNVNLPWNRVLADARGDQWFFEYRGGSVVKIRPFTARLGDWTNVISLDAEGIAPQAVTAVWLGRRCREWIKELNADLKTGQLT